MMMNPMTRLHVLDLIMILKVSKLRPCLLESYFG